jgi:hypothetical protein
MPKRMKAPWDTTRAEIRCHDVAANSFAEFQDFVKKYTGPKERFLDPDFTHQHAVRLSFRRKSHLMQNLINYMGRDFRYSERNRNCQTFATDFYSFLCGKKGWGINYFLLFLIDFFSFRNYSVPSPAKCRVCESNASLFVRLFHVREPQRRKYSAVKIKIDSEFRSMKKK